MLRGCSKLLTSQEGNHFSKLEDKFFPVYKSGVYREFKAINFGNLLKPWPIFYRYKFNEC